MEPWHRKNLRRVEQRDHARLLNFACYQNLPMLGSDRVRGWLADAINAAHEKHGFRLWAYAIMPDHVHLLVWPRGEVPAILQAIKQPVARRAVRYAREHSPAFLSRMASVSPSGKRTHHFWQRGGGYDRNLWEPETIWKAIDYIHMNPVKAGLCKRPQDWRWSSAAFFECGEAGPIAMDTAGIPARPAWR